MHVGVPGHRPGRLRRRTVAALGVSGVLLTGLWLSGCSKRGPEPAEPNGTAVVASSVAAAPGPNAPAEAELPHLPGVGEETSLFDGKTLGQWKVTDFGGQGDVYVKDGAIHMEMGSYMTGVTWAGPVARIDYEIALEAMRVEGSDFFCALTFPVGDRSCSLILGGWGGTVCGLSNIDYYDASENETTQIIAFENGRWYRVRLRVRPYRIQAWLDDEVLIDVDTEGRHIDIRSEVDLSRPLGIATWMTTGAVREIRLRKLPDTPPED